VHPATRVAAARRTVRTLRDTRTPVSDPVAIGAFADPTPLDWLTDADRVVVAVGDTWAMELSWAALWGRAELDPLPPVADPRLMAPRVPAVGAARGASGAET
jgi:hypothetical protein